MRQNSLLETGPDDEVTPVKDLPKVGFNAFKFDGSPNSAIVREVSEFS
jgi:hypothetical protein